MQIHLVRHAHAGSRSAWDEDDRGGILDPVAELRCWSRNALWRVTRKKVDESMLDEPEAR